MDQEQIMENLHVLKINQKWKNKKEKENNIKKNRDEKNNLFE